MVVDLKQAKRRREEALDKLLAQMTAVSERLATLEGQLRGKKQVSALTDEVVKLKNEIETLTIEKGRREEEFEKREREVRHKVGLERERQTFEVDKAKKEIELKIREGNLKAEQDRFEKEMAFTRKRFEEEVTYLKDMMSEILERLPKIDIGGELTLGGGGKSTKE